METTLETAFYFLAILNPASKIMFLASYEPALTPKQNFELTWKSSGAALLILLILAAVGQVLLDQIFRVKLYSLQLTGGLVLFVIGWTAVGTGRFVKRPVSQTRKNSLTDISLVPLAAPLIAGPGMIAAAIAGSISNGWLPTALALGCAILINFVLMLFAGKINTVLERTHLLGPLIRLTGLVIAVVAMQMIFTGLRTGFGFGC